MPSTEFLLYLVIIIFVLYVVMNYNKDQAHEDIQYKYIPVYRSESESKKQEKCNNQRCIQSGRCVCGNNQNVNINNVSVNEESWGGGYGGGYGRGGPGPVGGPGAFGGLSGPGGPGVPPVGPGPNPLRQFDVAAIEDPLTPPFRRSYYDDYVLPIGLMPTYSRGPPGRFRKVGTLVSKGTGSNDRYHFMNLFGREKYSCRDMEYYATDIKNKVKFYIETRGKEISEGDFVKIPELAGYEYEVRMFEDLSPKYDPYFI